MLLHKLYQIVLPEVKPKGFDPADLRKIAMDSGAHQTNEYSKFVRSPLWIRFPAVGAAAVPGDLQQLQQQRLVAVAVHHRRGALRVEPGRRLGPGRQKEELEPDPTPRRAPSPPAAPRGRPGSAPGPRGCGAGSRQPPGLRAPVRNRNELRAALLQQF